MNEAIVAYSNDPYEAQGYVKEGKGMIINFDGLTTLTIPVDAKYVAIKGIKKAEHRKIAKATAERRGIPKCIVDWRLARGWPLCYLHCDTIDDKGMH